MSVNTVSHAANIWSCATSALTSTPQAQGLEAGRPNEAGAPHAKPNQAGGPAGGAPSPFQSLSSDLQSTLLRLQAQKGARG